MNPKLITNVTTKTNFINAFQKLELVNTDIVFVHTSLSKFYYIPGGPVTVVNALQHSLKAGTIMMPSQVTSNVDPASWEYPPVRKDLIQTIRDNMPPYDPATSITEYLGQTPEYFRNLPDVVRSTHPYLPIAIWGKNAEKIAATQPLNLPYGLNSPLDYLYQHHGKIIFLGTDYETCTMLHYAESTINRPTQTYSAATGINKDGKTIWTEYQNIDMDSYDDFNELGKVFEKTYPNSWKSLKLANGVIKVIDAYELVNFAQHWFRNKDLKLENSLN